MPRRLTEHNIQLEAISNGALEVIDGLQGAGYDALLVGGCVRDLLLDRIPKDFDVATSATPEQVKQVFSRARLVGRRFRIAHVRARREVIEVSTFRRHLDIDEPQEDHDHHSENGVLVRDNVYGAIDDDAFRRDFTVNALYFDITRHEVIDYVDGLADIETQTLRVIGDPNTRFREDPVRILRAIRFAAKLGLSLDPATEAAIEPTSDFLTAIPAARLFDEFTKMFMNGHAVAAFELMRQHDLIEILFPLPPAAENLVVAALASTDERIAENKPVTPGFVLAALLWSEFLARCDETATLGNPNDTEFHAAMAVIAEQQHTIAIPKRFSIFVRDVWQLQARLERRVPRTLAKLLDHRRFRAAYDFLVLRAKIGDADQAAADFWTELQELDPDERAKSVRGQSPKRRRRRRRGPKTPSDPSNTPSDST